MKYFYKELLCAFLLILLFTLSGCGRKPAPQTRVLGTVMDADSKTAISGVLVQMGQGKAYTDVRGQFSFTLEDTEFPVYLSFSCDGYLPLESEAIHANSDLLEVSFYMTRTKAQMEVSVDTLDFGVDRMQMPLEVRSVGTAPLQWAVTQVALPAWIKASSYGGTIAVNARQEVMFTVNRESLSLGDYEAVVAVYGGEISKEVTVKLRKEAAVLEANPFTYHFGFEASEAAYTFKNTGNAPLAWVLEGVVPAWLAVSATSGELAGGAACTLEFTADRTKMAYGTESATLILKAGDVQVALELTAVREREALTVTPSLIDWGILDTHASMEIVNTGKIPAHWRLEGALPEPVTVGQTEGTLAVAASAKIPLQLDRSKLDFGPWTATLTVMSGGLEYKVVLKAEKEHPRLAVAPLTEQDFGLEATSMAVTLTNDFHSDLSWELSDNFPQWLQASAYSGTVKAQHRQVLEFTANRDVLDWSARERATVTLTCGTDRFDLTFLVKKEDKPVDPEPEANILHLNAPSLLDWGETTTSTVFTVSRVSGIDDTPYAFTTDDARLYITPASGVITLEDSVQTVTVSLDKTDLPTGHYESHIVFNYAEGTATVAVHYSEPVHYFAPEVTTGNYEKDQDYRYRFQGTIISLGNSKALHYGHCWAKDHDMPTTEHAHTDFTTGGTEGQAYVSVAGQLEDGTWSYRAYVTNEVGTAYGETVSFTVAHQQLGAVTLSQHGKELSMVCNIPVLNMGPLEAHGFVWSRQPHPALDQEEVASCDLGTRSRLGNFSHSIEDMPRGETWYVRAFARNAAGISYSEEASFEMQITDPKVYMGDVTEVDYHAMTVRANILQYGSEPILDHGFVYNVITDISNPVDATIGSCKKRISLGALSENTNVFSTRLQELAINTNYYVRAYVVTAHGYYYSLSQWCTTKKDESVILQDGLLYYVRSTNNHAEEWTGITPGFFVSPGVSYTTETPGGGGQSLVFNGQNAYLYNHGGNPAGGHSIITVNLWLRFPSLLNNNKDKVYPFLGSMNPEGMYMCLKYENNDWYLYFRYSRGDILYKMALPKLGGMDISAIMGTDWHMLSFALGSESMSVFLDGNKMSSKQASFTVGTDDSFVVGAHAAARPNVLSEFLSAHMDHIRIYGRVLSDSEVKKLYDTKN